MKDLLDKMKKLSENKNGKVITFDFDNTIVKSFSNSSDPNEMDYLFGGINKEIIKRIKKFKDSGATVLVVTARHNGKEVPETAVKTILDRLDIEVDGVYYTNEQPKAAKLYELGSSLHYDDDPKEHDAIQAFGKLHKDFNIAVKYPDELLSDIDEVAKGILITSDGKFVIVQRSDSYEWDAVGGHLMDGEEAEFAFWRETKEEMGLDIFDVNYLGSKDTTWKKKNKQVHYFIGSVPYTQEELKGAIQLQWELAEYFCGDLAQVEEKMASADGSTQNLQNTVSFLDLENIMAEAKSYQQRRYGAKHRKMKGNILKRGPNKKIAATGMKNVTDMKRSKSAPPGFGAVGEQKEPNQRRKIKIRIKKASSKWPNNSSYDIFGSGPSDGSDDVG